MSTQPTVWERLRAPFRPEQIGKLPKPTKKDNPKGKCDECGGWHGLPAVHLDYVGHAELTERLLEIDPDWNWEPLSFDEHGQPVFVRDDSGRAVGLWIKLTIHEGVVGSIGAPSHSITRLGYGSVDAGAYDAEKQLIGDALRNAGMRFGIALDLWKKDNEANQPEAGPTETPGVDREFREGDACPLCKEVGARGRFQIAKGGRNAGSLQCTGKKDEQWMNHPAPVFEPDPAVPSVAAPSTMEELISSGECQPCRAAGFLSKSGAPVKFYTESDTKHVLCTGWDINKEEFVKHPKGAQVQPVAAGDIDPTEIPF